MKQILTLLFCLGAVASTFAQTSSEQSRDIILGKRSPSGSTSDRNANEGIFGNDRRIYDEQGNRNSYPSGTREQQIDQVNRAYDAKVQSIRNNSHLSSAEKERAIRELNNDRNKKLKEISGNYNSRNRKERDDDDKYKKEKKHKSNNGNHYGWEKGKGNPHKINGKSKNR